MAALDRLPLWPDTVDAFYADRACSIRSDATRKVWGYTYRQLQHRYEDHAIGDFTTDDLVAFVTQRGIDGAQHGRFSPSYAGSPSSADGSMGTWDGGWA